MIIYKRLQDLPTSLKLFLPNNHAIFLASKLIWLSLQRFPKTRIILQVGYGACLSLHSREGTGTSPSPRGKAGL